MISVATIASAILLLEPHVGRMATPYAGMVLRAARRSHVDPRLVVAIVSHESHWYPKVENAVQCVGLGQVCLRNFADCRADFSGVWCTAKRAQLLEPANNLASVAALLEGNRAYCRKTGHARLVHYLSVYAGTDGEGVVCGQRLKRGAWVTVKPAKAVADILGAWRRIR